MSSSTRTILISGGNSGIGLESARRLTALGHRVVLLGRDPSKGAAAVEELRRHPGTAEFLAVDLSTHDGVRAAAATLLESYGRFDGLLHCSGVLTFEDVRTADGLHPFFAVNFLSRYHLTQLLLPALRASRAAYVVMVTSKVPLDTRIDPDLYPGFTPFQFRRMTHPIQIGNHHYAAHLRDREPRVRAGVVNAGVAKTGIWRDTPLKVRILTTAAAPFLMNSVAKAAVNPVALCVDDEWRSGSYWPEPGRPHESIPLELDPEETARVIETSRALTGA
ncbi:MAG: SDR family NAD(P)-dependent oxidoreductase [Actinobacteria bacterium]|nr:SDR family NAD(P)-dependent oxidoreductase [Actinomycetota bacterium]